MTPTDRDALVIALQLAEEDDLSIIRHIADNGLMGGTQPTTRTWFVRVAPSEAQIRCSFRRIGKRVVRFTVQLEIWHQENWVPVVRYDNAHGFCPRDTLFPGGNQEKTLVMAVDVNAAFTHAVKDLQANWRVYRARYLGEVWT